MTCKSGKNSDPSQFLDGIQDPTGLGLGNERDDRAQHFPLSFVVKSVSTRSKGPAASATACVALTTWSAALESGQRQELGHATDFGHLACECHWPAWATWHPCTHGTSRPGGLPTARVSYSLASSSDSPAALISFFTLASVFRSLLAPRAASVQPLVFKRGGEWRGQFIIP